MKFRKLMNPDLIILLTALIGGGVVATGAFYASKKKSEESEAQIKRLEHNINTKDEELQLKQERIEDLTRQVLSFTQNIDSNTIEIKNLSDNIKEISKSTNSLSNIIKNEQRRRGKVTFYAEEYDNYSLYFGPRVVGGVTKYDVMNSMEMFGVSYFITYAENQIHLSLILKDKSGEILFNMQGNEWVINKGKVLSLNYDTSSMEIVDYGGNVIFQVDINKNNVEILGWFYHKKGLTVISKKEIKQYNFEELNQLDIDELMKKRNHRIKPKFQHQGEDYLGKRIGKFSLKGF